MTAVLTTATVETLVAEVRVVMVGSRQVTLSVARQLDELPLEQVEPLGRIALYGEGTEALPARGWVIGRSTVDGALVRAKFGDLRSCPFIGGLSGRVTVCRAVQSGYGGVYSLKFNGTSIDIESSSVESCGHADHGKYGCEERCPHWLTNGLEGEIAAQIEEHRVCVACHQAARALPLIVLAGLR